jgi:VWFA-related protein
MRFKLSVVVGLLSLIASSPAQAPITEISYSESAPYIPRVVSNNSQKRSSKSDADASSATIVTENRPMRLQVSVLDSNRKPIAGLTREDFKLLVDEQETEIVSLESGKEPVTFLFMIDNSVSSTMAIKDLAARIERVLDALVPGDRIMVIAFSARLKVVCELTDDPEKARKAISRVTQQTESGTSIYDHIQNVSTSLIPNIVGPVAVILFTDGVDTTSSKAQFDTSLVDAERVNAAYYVVHLDTLSFELAQITRVQNNIRGLPIIFSSKQTLDPVRVQQHHELARDYLNDLIKLSGGQAARDPNSSNSNVISSTELPQIIRSRYVISFTPRPGSRAGQRHGVRLQVNRPRVSVVTRGSLVTPAR